MKYLDYIQRRAFIHIIGIVCALQIAACKMEFLEAKPDKNLAVPTTLQDFQGLLDRLTVITQNSPPRGEIASDGHYVTDVVYQNRIKDPNTDSYIWSKTQEQLSVVYGSTNWAQPYERVLYCNIVLDGLKKVKPLDQAERRQFNDVKGQALFQRARTFFEFAQIYAPPYNLQTAGSELGIVMRLSSDISLPSKRATVQETYNQILNDLLEAKDMLPDRPAILTRASKSATLALLARVYLVMEDYANALKHADESLMIYSTLLDYNGILASANFIGRYNSEVLFHANYVDNFLTTNYLVDRGFYELYHLDDLRKTRMFRENLTTNVVTFKGNYEGTTSNLFCGLATDEVYLVRAECYARAGRVAEAMKDLNDLMKMRWDNTKTYPVITANDAEDALRKILLERRKELVNRGIRWSDLRRLNRDPRFAITLIRTVAGVTYTLEPNSYKYTFPIPDDIIQQTGIAQNRGWAN